ncbi:hypothetical protein [Alteraurantiacibacter aestuarii]|uniref:Uncharacterized protein n=1 Tax=Alteraurantiacibacter aestuarii TaxID=650004 RepID=A0A844ZR65_9SPHN|nr:hypothetical protein [Alteraurantiacibacter aestuarii]MXO88099.1 hypothetical protein [Alteraurantiacibacter aestuarii]
MSGSTAILTVFSFVIGWFVMKILMKPKQIHPAAAVFTWTLDCEFSREGSQFQAVVTNKNL